MEKITLYNKKLSTLKTTILFHLVLGASSIFGLFFDHRLVGGFNPWIKPLKFDLSIIIFLATVGWVSRYLKSESQQKFAFKFSICMLIEISIITLQALRGVNSHFNRSTILDFALFIIMGITIVYNTLLLWKLLKTFTIEGRFLPRLYYRGIQYGIVSILISAIPGVAMIVLMNHTVGGGDLGHSLPFLHWSLTYGDLRPAHFIGMHGFQLFIMLGGLLAFKINKRNERTRFLFLNGLFILFLVFNFLILLQALSGIPISESSVIR